MDPGAQPNDSELVANSSDIWRDPEIRTTRHWPSFCHVDGCSSMYLSGRLLEVADVMQGALIRKALHGRCGPHIIEFACRRCFFVEETCRDSLKVLRRLSTKWWIAWVIPCKYQFRSNSNWRILHESLFKRVSSNFRGLARWSNRCRIGWEACLIGLLFISFEHLLPHSISFLINLPTCEHQAIKEQKLCLVPIREPISNHH